MIHLFMGSKRSLLVLSWAASSASMPFHTLTSPLPQVQLPAVGLPPQDPLGRPTRGQPWAALRWPTPQPCQGALHAHLAGLAVVTILLPLPRPLSSARRHGGRLNTWLGDVAQRRSTVAIPQSCTGRQNSSCQIAERLPPPAVTRRPLPRLARLSCSASGAARLGFLSSPSFHSVCHNVLCSR